MFELYATEVHNQISEEMAFVVTSGQMGKICLYDFLVTIKAAPYECKIRTGLP